ncbi:hypothetical protein GCM10023237_66860 [Streptomyces coeruleoprunus]
MLDGRRARVKQSDPLVECEALHQVVHALVPRERGIGERPPTDGGLGSRTHGRDTSRAERHRSVKRFDAVTTRI